MKTKNDVLNEFSHDKKGELDSIIFVEILLDIRDQLARVGDHLADANKRAARIGYKPDPD